MGGHAGLEAEDQGRRLLKDNHFIYDFKILDDGRFGVLRVYLKYHEEGPVIRHLERVSRPGRRCYVAVDEIPRVRNGLGMAILSTSQGLMSTGWLVSRA